MKKQGKPVKWHMSFGPRSPRINLEKLEVVNHVLSRENLDKEVAMRVEKPSLRQVSIIVSDKEFAMMKKDIRANASHKDIKHAGIFLYGQGVYVAEFITHEIDKFRKDMIKKADDAKKKEGDDDEKAE